MPEQTGKGQKSRVCNRGFTCRLVSSQLKIAISASKFKAALCKQAFWNER